MKYCKYCGRDLPDTMFCHHPTTRDKLHNKCRDCQREYKKLHPPKPRPKLENANVGRINERLTPEEKARRMEEWRTLNICRHYPHEQDPARRDIKC